MVARTIPLSRAQRTRLAELRGAVQHAQALLEEATNAIALAVVKPSEIARCSVAMEDAALVVTVRDAA